MTLGSRPLVWSITFKRGTNRGGSKPQCWHGSSRTRTTSSLVKTVFSWIFCGSTVYVVFNGASIGFCQIFYLYSSASASADLLWRKSGYRLQLRGLSRTEAPRAGCDSWGRGTAPPYPPANESWEPFYVGARAHEDFLAATAVVSFQVQNSPFPQIFSTIVC